MLSRYYRNWGHNLALECRPIYKDLDAIPGTTIKGILYNYVIQEYSYLMLHVTMYIHIYKYKHIFMYIVGRFKERGV